MTRVRRLAARVVAGLLIVLAAAALVVGLRVRRFVWLFSGVAAKQMCSCVFVDDRDADACRGDVPPVADGVGVAVDREGRTVRAGVPVLAARTAAYREGSGCTLR